MSEEPEIRSGAHAALMIEDLRGQLAVAEFERDRLRAAITRHRDQRADDRCQLDDRKLYLALGDGVEPDFSVPPRDYFLANCARFYDRRCTPGNWPSYQQLERLVEAYRNKRAGDGFGNVLMADKTLTPARPWRPDEDRLYDLRIDELERGLGVDSGRFEYKLVPFDRSTGKPAFDPDKLLPQFIIDIGLLQPVLNRVNPRSNAGPLVAAVLTDEKERESLTQSVAAALAEMFGSDVYYRQQFARGRFGDEWGREASPYRTRR